MKEKKLFDAITDVQDELVEEARTTKLKRTFFTWQKITAIAVCAAMVIGAVFILPHSGNGMDPALMNVVFPKAYAFDDDEARRTVTNSNPVGDRFLKAVNDFSYATSSKLLADHSGNTNYSPLSLYYALALAAVGAEGETADELHSLLGVSDSDELSEQGGNLYRQLYSDNKIGKLKIANSLWMDDKITWNLDYVKNAAENFYASSYSVDLADTKTSKAMAQWVSEHTNGTLSPEFETNSEQILSILNTVYFYDQWMDKFDKSKNEEDTFYLSDGTTVSGEFMNGAYGSAGFTKGEGFIRAGLGLKNSGRMVFILPDEGVSLKTLLSSPEQLRSVFEGGEDRYGEVVWQIPKFSFDSKFDLASAIKDLGVHTAFEQDANFSGMTNETAFISNIRQETHIAIDENGVEASAFTEMGYAGSAPPEGRADMILNRPFLYGITAPNGTLLFVGICENPAAN